MGGALESCPEGDDWKRALHALGAMRRMCRGAQTLYIKIRLRKSGVKRSAIFGSYARGEATNASDVDLLIEPPKGATLLDIIELEQKLASALHRDVDLLTYRSVYRPLRRRIFREAVPLYERR